MEIDLIGRAEYDKAHPNYQRWKRAREISWYRAEFVKSVVSNFISCSNLKILDIGSGMGTTAKLFALENFVISFERKIEHLKLQKSSGSLSLIAGDAANLPFKHNRFDVIILQDSIEHLKLKNDFFDQLHKILKAEGLIYLSTPNRFSVLNILADPHWGLPGVSLLKREKIKKYFLKHFRKNDYNREDIAELFSLKFVTKMIGQKFDLFINTSYAVSELMRGNKGLIWSSFHLKLLKLIQSLKIEKMIIKTVNNKPGIINRFVTPTFYLILKRK